MRIVKSLSHLIFLSLLLYTFNFAAAADTFKNSFENSLNTTANGTGHAAISSAIGSSPAVIVGKMIKALLSLLGIIFLILIVYSGIKWMTARGNDAEVKKAQDTLKNATIGLIIVLLAYAITAYVGNAFSNSLGGISSE